MRADGLARRLAGTLGAQSLVLGLVAVEQILLLPFFIAAWGAEDYRDWLVILAAAEFLTLLDLGLQNYFANTLMRSQTRRENEDYARQKAVAWTLYALLMLIGVAVLMILPRLLGGDAQSFNDAFGVGIPGLALWYVLGTTVLLRVPMNIFSNVYRARGEPARAQLFQGGGLLLRIVLCLLALSLGFGPLVLAFALLTGWILVTVAGFWDQHRRYGEMLPRWVLPSRSEIRSAFGTGLVYNLHALGATFSVQGLVLLVSQLAPTPAAVLLLTTARTLTGVVRQIGQQTALITGVEMSREYASESDRLMALHHFSLRLNGVIVGLLAGMVAVMGGRILPIWARGEVPYEPWLFLTLLASIIVSMPAWTAAQLLYFTNQPRQWAVAQMGMAAGIGALGVWLIPAHGALGAALSLLTAETVFVAGWLGLHAARSLQRGLWAVCIEGLGWSGAGLVVSILAGGLVMWVDPAAWIGLEGWWGLGIELSAWALVVSLPGAWLAIPAEYRRRFLGRYFSAA